MKKILLILFVFVQHTVLSQTNLFSKKYSHTSPKSIVRSFDKGFILVGSKVTKIDSIGNVQWCKDFGKEINYIISTPDSAYVICASKDLAKIDRNGSVLWSKIFMNSGNMNLGCIVQTLDKGFLIHGSRIGVGLGNIIKTDSLGLTQWSFIISTNTLSNYIIAADQLPDSSYVVLMRGSQNYTESPVLVGLNKNGIHNWSRIYSTWPSASYWNGLDMELVNDGVIMFTDKGWLVKTDFLGTVQWIKKYKSNGMSNYSGMGCIVKTSDGGFVFGRNELIKIDASANPIWKDSLQIPIQIIEDHDMGIVSLARSLNGEAVISKSSLNGTSLCSSTMTCTHLSEFIVDYTTTCGVQNGILASNSSLAASSSTYSMINFCLDVGLEETKIKSLVNIYPNPTEGVLRLTGIEDGIYFITDLVGRQILEGKCESNAIVDLSPKPAGIYFIHIKDRTGKTLDTRKLIKK